MFPSFTSIKKEMCIGLIVVVVITNGQENMEKNHMLKRKEIKIPSPAKAVSKFFLKKSFLKRFFIKFYKPIL